MIMRRVRSELRDLQELIQSQERRDGNQTLGIRIEAVDDSLLKLRAQIIGPQDTPYAGGTFDLDVEIPQTYPFNPPKMKFATRIWHPNVSSVTGAICLDILKDQWAAAMTIRTTLISIQALLSAPFPDNPQDAVVANQYLTNLPMFNLTAQHWTAVFAQGPNRVPDLGSKVEFVMGMLGIPEDGALTILSSNEWDVHKAVDGHLER